ACQNQQGWTVKERLGRVFARYGLPNRILCDNGAPWGGAEAACPYTEFCSSPEKMDTKSV
ncbi:MAG TPA: hypothetical protein VG649_01020, partial [Candidatus Angelobacter sp.]|nr:hypothetical protein [Candidatus Angelobacter sp.]